MIRVGIVDSGIDGAARARLVAVADFEPGAATRELAVAALPPLRDRCGHGSRVAAIVAQAPAVELLDARVFFDTLSTSAAQAAAAIEWSIASGACVLNLSFGLREDRVALQEACARAIAQGVVLVAATPARGTAVFPASYAGVIRATGDARCAPGEISWLDTAQADFGGHARSLDGALAGASAGCAWVCAALASALGRTANAAGALAALRDAAAYRGPERRT